MKLNTAYLAVILLVGAAPAVCRAQDFSADVVFFDGNVNAASAKAATPGPDLSRLFVSEDKIRLEVGGSARTVVLLNAAEQTAYALFPAKKEYEPLAGGLSEYFRVSDAENACSDWQKSSAQKIDCEKVGREVVDGRQTVKYRNKGASDVAISAVWIDVKMKFVLKWEGGGSGVVLRNIQEGKQAADLFTLPSDYDITKPRKGTNKGFSQR
jgi:hypothetical protein